MAKKQVDMLLSRGIWMLSGFKWCGEKKNKMIIGRQ